VFRIATDVSVIGSDTAAWIGNADINHARVKLKSQPRLPSRSHADYHKRGVIERASLPGDSHVTYLKGAPANTAIGGLTDGQEDFVRERRGTLPFTIPSCKSRRAAATGRAKHYQCRQR